jgi:hypothetical protein
MEFATISLFFAILNYWANNFLTFNACAHAQVTDLKLYH